MTEGFSRLPARSRSWREAAAPPVASRGTSCWPPPAAPPVSLASDTMPSPHYRGYTRPLAGRSAILHAVAGEAGVEPYPPAKSAGLADLAAAVLREVLDRLTPAAPALAGGLRGQLAGELRTLKELLMEARPPKLMIVGRRGAGKSSLVTAVVGEQLAAVGSVLAQTGELRWYSHSTARGELRLLDTRGLGDSSRPEAANFRGALAEIAAALDSEPPDSVLFLCKAKEVDSRIGEDIDNLVEIRSL